MVILDFSTAVLIVVFYLLLGIFDIVPLIAVTMIILSGIQGAYQPTVKASIPILVDDEHNMQANSIVDIIGSLANMIGPVTGGILYSVFGLTPILYVGAACFFASAFMEIFINIPFEKIENALYLPFYTAGLLVIGLCIFTRHIFYKNDCVDSTEQSVYGSTPC